jgi:PAS domain S-box-containing protein
MRLMVLRIISAIALAELASHGVLDLWLKTPAGPARLFLETALTVAIAAPYLCLWGRRELRRRQEAEEAVRLTTAREMSELRLDEAALQESRAYFEAIINAIGHPIFVKDRRHRWVLLNDACCRFMGYPRERLMGKSDLDFFPKEQVEVFWAGSDRVFETGQIDISEEQLTDASGQVHAISTVKTLYVDKKGDRYIVGTIRDISDRKRAEEEKAAVEAQFRQAQKMEAVGLLAGGIAHDFNNVLTTIVGYNYFIMDGLRTDHPLRAFSLEVKRAAEVAASLTRQLLAVTRRQVVRPRVMDLNAVIIETSKLFRRLLGENIKLAVDAQSSLWPVKMDSGQLEQVVLNLVVNARDAMPLGGRLTISTKNATVGKKHGGGLPPGIAPGQYVCLEVRDTGQGMEPGVKARIFEPFFTTKEVGRGTGLGLSTVQSIVQECRGRVSVESEAGHGSVFRIHLPRAEGGVEALLPGELPKTTRGGNETILVVEDNSTLRALIKRALRQKGYRVFSAGTGEAGVNLCRHVKEYMHLLLSDLVLPDTNGVDLSVRLTAMRPGLKTVFMSGYPDGVMGSVDMSDDAVLIEKPFSPETLLSALRRVLDPAPIDLPGLAPAQSRPG